MPNYSGTARGRKAQGKAGNQPFNTRGNARLITTLIHSMEHFRTNRADPGIEKTHGPGRSMLFKDPNWRKLFGGRLEDVLMPGAMVALRLCLAAVSVAAFGQAACAADLSVPAAVGPAAGPPRCGPCGCLGVAYVYHRSLESTYGVDFDPRNYDQTVPHYYFGRVRAYPRYFVDGVPVTGPCY
jgi:hypothetical protein